jgi:hypothetical protein
MNTSEAVIFFDAILIILLSSYGVNAGFVPLNSLQTIGSPPVTPPPAVNSPALVSFCSKGLAFLLYQCINYDINVITGAPQNTTSGVATALIDLAGAVIQIPALIAWLLTAVVIFANVMLAIVFSPSFNGNGVPYLGYIFIALQIYVIRDGIIIVRGSSTGV